MTDVRLRPMTEEEYATWRTASLASYVDEIVEAGRMDRADAQRRAEAQHAEFLPDGPATPRVHLLRVLDETGAPVGWLWLGPHPRRDGAGYIYDIEIVDERRGEGLGRATMVAAERIGREAGWSELGLNVFGPNVRARALYDSLGYTVVSTTMTKRL